MHRRYFGGAVAALAMLAVAGAVPADEAATDSSSASDTEWMHRCKALASADFSGVLDAPAQVTEVKPVDAGASLPAYCQVGGYVAPSVGFELRLPVDWNGKYLQVGCGGFCGSIDTAACDNALRRRYACLASDMGHKGTGADALWGYNNLAAKIDWGFRATHVAALAGKSVTEHYYSRAPGKSYFMGCSTGGRQALQAAQLFPWDFDGIVAGAPPVEMAKLFLNFVWGIQSTRDGAGKVLLGNADLKLLTAAAVARCDLDDGLEDGIIGDPLSCAFDPSVLACKPGAAHDCLTAAQIEAVEKIYAGPTNSSGERLTPGGPVPGSEYGPWMGSQNDWSTAYLGADGKPSIYERLITDGLRYLYFLPEPGPSWKIGDFNFDHDYPRMGMMQALYDSSNPDLRRFKSAGGKLLVYQGVNDNSVLPRYTLDYYETVERTMGGRANTQDFFRLFVLPGALHCRGGNGAFAVDYLSYLEDWVENGRAPDKLISSNVKLDDLDFNDAAARAQANRRLQFPLDPAHVAFSRPVYPYPLRVKYSGRGDPAKAESFRPVQR